MSRAASSHLNPNHAMNRTIRSAFALLFVAIASCDSGAPSHPVPLNQVAQMNQPEAIEKRRRASESAWRTASLDQIVLGSDLRQAATVAAHVSRRLADPDITDASVTASLGFRFRRGLEEAGIQTVNAPSEGGPHITHADVFIEEAMEGYIVLVRLRTANSHHEFHSVRTKDQIIQRSSDYIPEAGYRGAVNRDVELTINSLAAEMVSIVTAEAGIKSK